MAKLTMLLSLTGEVMYNLDAQLRAQFREIRVVDGDVSAVIIDGGESKKETKVGSASHDYIAALVLGSMGGRGDGPGGCALWVDENASKMTKLNKYTIIATPKSRGGILEAPVPAFLAIAKARAKVISDSLKLHPIEKRVRAKKEEEKEEIEVVL